MTALVVGVLFFLGINLIAWGSFYVVEQMYDRYLDRKLARLRHPSAQRMYPISNVKVLS